MEVAAIIANVCVSSLLIVTLVGLYKPDLKSIFVVLCVATIWILAIFMNSITEDLPQLSEQEVPAINLQK